MGAPPLTVSFEVSGYWAKFWVPYQVPETGSWATPIPIEFAAGSTMFA